MKALLVLFGVAGAVLAVLLVGGLSRPDRPTPPVAVTQALDQDAPIELAAVDPEQWARFRRQADAICGEAQRDVQRQLDRIRFATVPEQVIVSLDRTLRIQTRTVTRLTRLKRPTGLQMRIAEFLAVFRAQLADDRRLVRQLRDDPVTIPEAERALRREERRVKRVTTLADQLGVIACSRYLDYDFYE